jgi:acetoin utilization protein AcuB
MTTVSELMSRNLIQVSPEDSVEKAVQLLRRRGVRHLLVMKKNKLVGIVSDRDLKRVMDPRKTRKKLLGFGGLFFLLEPILVREIMTPDPITIAPDCSVQEAASVMVAERFGALPVTQKDQTVGIITETDLLRFFAKAPPAEDPDTKKGSRSRPAGKK